MACRLAGLSRFAYRRPSQSQSTDDPDAGLRDWLRAWAKDHPRCGYRAAYHDARAEGWVVNHRKIQRLWREEGLRVRLRRRRKRIGVSTAETAKADRPNAVWGIDFHLDSDEAGRVIKICSIVDEYTPAKPSAGSSTDLSPLTTSWTIWKPSQSGAATQPRCGWIMAPNWCPRPWQTGLATRSG